MINDPRKLISQSKEDFDNPSVKQLHYDVVSEKSRQSILSLNSPDPLML